MIQKKGFTLIEIIISLGLAALILPALGRLYTFALTTSNQGDKYSKAYALAQEGMEAVYYIKENRTNAGDIWDWNTSPINMTSEAADEYYQLTKASGTWEFNGGKKTKANLVPQNGFTSSIQIFRVDRDTSLNIGSGTEDKETRKVVSKVFWEGTAGEEEVSISSYVTKH